MFWPYEAERINDAFNNSSQEKWDQNSAFKTEFERQYYINGLSSQKVDEAIAWLEKSENARITGRDMMLTKLKAMKWDLWKMQTRVRSETSQIMFDVNNPIKIDRTNFGDLITTRTYNDHYMPNGGWYIQENPTVKGISVIWNSDKKTIHSIVVHGNQYIREPDGWFKSSTNQKILVELEWDNIYINRKVAAPAPAFPVIAKWSAEVSWDLRDFQEKMKGVKFTINGKDGTVNKIDKVSNELIVELDSGSTTVYFEKKGDGYVVAEKSAKIYTIVDAPASNGNTRMIFLTAKDSAVLSKASTQGDNRNGGDRGWSATKPPAKETVKTCTVCKWNHLSKQCFYKQK